MGQVLRSCTIIVQLRDQRGALEAMPPLPGKERLLQAVQKNGALQTGTSIIPVLHTDPLTNGHAKTGYPGRGLLSPIDPENSRQGGGRHGTGTPISLSNWGC